MDNYTFVCSTINKISYLNPIFQGFGMKQDDAIAEHYWLLAGKEGDPDGSVAAQSQLGMFYTRRDTKDPKKAFYWHYFAAENGSLESKGRESKLVVIFIIHGHR